MMKTSIKYICLMALLTLVGTTTVSAQAAKDLWIYHTNDTHSRIFPLPSYESDTLIAGKAGYVRRITLVKQLRAEHPDMLLFDCGDFSQGSPYYNLFKGDVEVALMNELHYDAGTIGNHEFDFGMENMARLFRMSNHPIVCSNYDFAGTPVEGLTKDYLILERNGLKIGVFGLSPELHGLVASFNYEGVTFKDPYVEAQRVADFLKNDEHCDLVICLSHLGWQTPPYCDELLAAKTRNIDLILGGHSHSYFDEPVWYTNLDGIQVPVQQMGKHGAFVGQYHVEFEKK